MNNSVGKGRGIMETKYFRTDKYTQIIGHFKTKPAKATVHI